MNKKEEKIKKAKCEYIKAWRKKNPDKVKAYEEKYWLNKANQSAKEKERNEENK